MSLPVETNCRSVKSRLDAGEHVLLLDCRERDEWETARIEGAMLLPMSQLSDSVHELESSRDREIIVYCHHGARSLRVAHWLRRQGFALVQSMMGGIEEWSLTIDSAVPRY